TDCPARNPRLTRPGLALRKPQRIPTITTYARQNPISGDNTIGITTFSRITTQCTVTEAARAAPMRPPISACDEDDGRPRRHVMRFQIIAPVRPANTTVIPCAFFSGVMMPLPMVEATPSDTRAP